MKTHKLHLEINPPSLAPPDGHFSQCTVVQASTRMLFISGQMACDAQGKTIGVGNMTAQAEQVFCNLKAALEAHGATFENVVKATLFITRMGTRT